jgi:hypothetical protein
LKQLHKAATPMLGETKPPLGAVMPMLFVLATTLGEPLSTLLASNLILGEANSILKEPILSQKETKWQIC